MKCKIVGITLMIIFLTGCASTVPETKLMPKESDNVFPFLFQRDSPLRPFNQQRFILLSLDRQYLLHTLLSTLDSLSEYF